MKLCYVLLVHHKFDQAVRLVRRLVAPGVSIVVHIDKKVTHGDVTGFQAALAPFDCVTYTPRIDALWGSYRQALAIMTGIQTAARHAHFDRCILLSGQDYPIASHDAIVAFSKARRTGNSWKRAHSTWSATTRPRGARTTGFAVTTSGWAHGVSSCRS